MLQINNLSMTAGKFSIDDINLLVPDGCCHVLLGGTGNGKTLILEAIAGLRSIKSGEIYSDGINIEGEFPENRYISYVPQDLALFPHLNVEKNILYPKRFKKNHIRSDEEIREIIKYLQIENILHRSIKNLSGGEKQRVALARAFVSGNKVLLLDEPFSALHFTLKRTLWGMLTDIQKRFNISILMVTHDLEEAEFLADYVSILYKGRIMQSGIKEEVFENPTQIEVTKITGHYNYFSGEVIGINDDSCIVYISSLDSIFSVNNIAFIKSDKVTIAIRTNKIKINPLDDKIPNTIKCKMQNLYKTSNYNQLALLPDKMKGERIDEVEEIVVDFYDDKNLDFEQGQKITIHIPINDIYVFKNN